MISFEYQNDYCTIHLTGWHLIWGLRSKIVIPYSQIVSFEPHTGAYNIPWCRCPGTALPRVIIAGTYLATGRKEFWYMRFKHNEIAITLKGHKFTRIVIEVDNPTQELANLATSIKRWSDLQLIASHAG